MNDDVQEKAERIVGEGVADLLADRAVLAEAVRKQGIAADRIPGLLKAASRWRGQVLDLVERVDLRSDEMAIGLNLGALSGETGIPVHHIVPTRIKRRGVEMRLVLEGASTETAKPDPALIKAIARAHMWFDDLAGGRARSLGEIAKKEGVTDRYVSHLMPLAFLAPEIVEAILAGTQPVDQTAERLTKRTELPLSWAEQKASLDFA